MDKDQNHLAYIGCHHNEIIPLYDYANDRELSAFYEFVSNLENTVVFEYFKLEKDLKDKITWATAIFITDEKSNIIYETKPV